MEEILNYIQHKELAKALSMMEAYAYSHPAMPVAEPVAAIRNDYELMVNYWRNGYKDPQRQQVYDQLLSRLLAVVMDVRVKERISHSPLLDNLSRRVNNGRKEWTADHIRNKLETYVSDEAMLQLEQEHTRQSKSERLQEEHKQLAEDLFDYVLTCGMWSDSVADAFREILTLPTVDSIDQQLIVSAVTLSAMNAFDPHKFLVLADVYQTSTDEHVRQRALVGWALCIGAEPLAARQLPEVRRETEKMTSTPEWCEEMTELQLQLMYCMNEADDTRKIHDEIMPELLKNNSLRVTRNGIEEVEDDPIEDILNPDSSEKKMEKLEESMQKMLNMQRSGADIYFGGFAQMKRHPFFSQICNWFMPFYPNHPVVSGTWNGAQGKRFLHTLLKTGTFCDSDKYSFMLAYEKVVGMMPQNIIEMLEKGEATIPDAGIEPEEKRRPAFIRRMYLQDLYRFFRLYPSRSLFRNPFSEEPEERRLRLFFSNELCRGAGLGSHFNEVVAFLLKRGHYDEASAVLANYDEELRDYQYYQMCGSVLMHTKQGTVAGGRTAAECFRMALQLKPDSERALQGLARASFMKKDYEGALEAYDRLLLIHEGHRSYLLNKAVCLANLSRFDDAQKILYQLDYEYPDDDHVSRVLAWTLMSNGRLEQAEKIYDRLLGKEVPDTDDYLNDGLRLWIEGQITKAAARFKETKRLRDGAFDAEKEFFVEAADLLKRHGISDVEIRLMVEEIGEG